LTASGAAPAGLRRRLLLAFLLVTVPPLLLLCFAGAALLSDRLERAARERLDAGLVAARSRIEALARRSREQVAAVAASDLSKVPSEGDDRQVIDEIARRRDLVALEIVDGAGLVVASHHWPAGFGLPAQDRLFPSAPVYRLLTVAEGYGAGERLAVVAETGGRWRGQNVLVRGGAFLDEPFLSGLAEVMGLEVALRDGVRGRWIAPPAAHLLTWSAPPLGSGRGEVTLKATPLRWAAAPLAEGLTLVVAAAPGAFDEAVRDVRRLMLAAALLALLGTLLGALVVSGRLAGPIRELASAVHRVSEGDLGVAVPVRNEDEIGDLARAFNDMTAELRVSRARLVQAERVSVWREIARRLAHELRKPLFPIQLSIETLRRSLDRAPAPSPADFEALFRESSETILQELRSLRRIVDSFGDLARLPKPRLVAMDLAHLAEQVLSLYRPGAARITIEAALDAEAPVRGDPELLARAVGNLVANAIEAMPEEGTLRIRIVSTADETAVEIEDTGPGLGEDEIARLFTPYRTTKPGGTGLGLVIAQGIAADHGGRIDVRSAPGQGSTFRLVLPYLPYLLPRSTGAREKLSP
jgi:two-component system, NtrC family, nitrogen regulation sensor histidine kinase NtrY